MIGGSAGWDREGEAMSSVIQSYSIPETQHLALAVVEQQPWWFAIHTRARHEKQIETRLRDCGISTFLPVVKEVHRWSDRRKIVELPLFSCYLFVHIAPSEKTRLTVLGTDGVIGLVGVRGRGTPVPDAEIECIRQLLNRNIALLPHAFLKVGQRVRIRGGSLDGIEGVIAGGNGDRKLVVSIELIQRSVAVTVEGYDIEAINPQNNPQNAQYYCGRI